MDKVQHFEIPADDLARARKFYEDTFGWKTADWPMPNGSVYVGLQTGPINEKRMPSEPGFINGGMYQRNGKFSEKAVITLVVQNMDAAIEKVKAGGGKIVAEPRTIAGIGIYAYINDTEDNTIGLWQELDKTN